MRLHVVTRMPHDRVVLSTGLSVCGEHIASGIDVGIYALVLHYRVDIFGEDVDVFRPERWLGDEEEVRTMKNTMFTFSSGKYNCLGKNIARMELAKARIIHGLRIHRQRIQEAVYHIEHNDTRTCDAHDRMSSRGRQMGRQWQIGDG